MPYANERRYKADINTASSGDNTIIAAPGLGKRIAIDFITLLPTTAVSVQMKDGSTAYGGPLPLDIKQPFTFENAIHDPEGVINCSDNAAFVINLGGAVQVGGFVKYRIINS